MTKHQAAKRLAKALKLVYGDDHDIVVWSAAETARFTGHDGTASIVWEGGPCEWAIAVSLGQCSPEIRDAVAEIRAAGYFTEPWNGFILCVYDA